MPRQLQGKRHDCDLQDKLPIGKGRTGSGEVQRGKGRQEQC